MTLDTLAMLRFGVAAGFVPKEIPEGYALLLIMDDDDHISSLQVSKEILGEKAALPVIFEQLCAVRSRSREEAIR